MSSTRLFFLEIGAALSLLTVVPSQATETVSGVVLNATTDEALANANIGVMGTLQGTTTNQDGRFSLAVEALPITLVVRHIGYRTAEVVISDDSPIEVALFDADVQVEELVVVGSRTQPRSATESMVPIDAFSTAELTSQGHTDLGNALRTLVPSYNVAAHPISDAATLVRPASLRNLAPEHTLLLVNGKRRHRSAVIGWLNGVTDGAQGPDVASIPSIALQQVEVLRDGAAAQYGSDAIAGVLNFRLKEDRSGGSIELNSGTYGEGDGERYAISGNIGLPLGASGFANLSLEYGNANPTNRSVQRADAAALIAAGNDAVANPAQIWGSPEIENDVKFLGNFGLPLTNDMQLYGHTSYASKKVSGGFYFRNPNNRPNIFSLDGGQTLLIGDVLAARGEGSAGCPTVAITNDMPDAAALAQVNSDPNCFSFREKFPGGFTPNFGGEVQDMAAVGGLRRIDGGLLWDASFSFGAHRADFFINNTVNASLGLDTPTEFDPGLYKQQDIGVNLDVAYALSDRLDIAGGGEWRQEQFTVGPGEEASWEVGPYAAQGFVSGSNGFPGFGPTTEGTFSRGNIALYGDLELSGLGDQWTLGTAVRFENFDDFGSTVNGKLSGRYMFTDAVALRTSASSGFRAPTPGQQNTANVQTTLNDALELVDSATVPSTSPIAQLRGGLPLEPERSISYAVGGVIDTGSFTLTADYFYVAVADRLALTQPFNPTEDERAGLMAQGVEGSENLSEFRFFANDFSTRTQGFDLVSTYAPPALGGTVLGFAFNHTQTEVTEFNPNFLSDGEILALEGAVPSTRWNVSVGQDLGRAHLLSRLSYYGSWNDVFIAKEIGVGPEPTTPLFAGNYIVDLELALSATEGTTLSLGGQNVLGTLSEENDFMAAILGMPYSQFTPWGINGAYYYLRLNQGFSVF